MSGLVVVCRGHSAEMLRMLDANAHLTLGPEQGSGRLPVVLDTDTHDEHGAQLAWLRGLPGVSHVELASTDYRDVSGGASDP